MPEARRSWREMLSLAQGRLEAAGIDEPAIKLRWVLADLFECNLLEALRHLPDSPTVKQALVFEEAVARLERDEPVQYVIGETEFMGLRIRCDSRALIPRPETEQLVLLAEEFLKGRGPAPVVVDVCTGSGCIACALAKRVPHARIRATDLSAGALALAQDNARALDAAVDFRRADLLEGIPDASVDLVISNPPYVSTEECDRLPRLIRDFEPRLALDGGPDGLQIISRLVSGAARVLLSGGQFILEIGENQADAVTELLCQTNHFHPIHLKSDYAGQVRVVRAQRRPRR